MVAPPQHPTLANKVKEIWQDEGARFVVFGAWAIEDNPCWYYMEHGCPGQ